MIIMIMFIGCRKNDFIFLRGKLMKCDVAEQKNVQFVYNVGVGFKKVYYPDGLVKSLRTKTLYAFNDFDSLQFHFNYNGNKAHVTGTRLYYRYHSDGNGGDIHYTNDEPPVSYDFYVTFDPKTFNVTKAGETTFTYDNTGRLISYNGFALVYDNKGNIIRVNGHDGFSVSYRYDYTRTAKQQLYYTTADFTNEMYNLMEILNWIPVQPVNLRTSHILGIGIEPDGSDTFWGEFKMTEHVLDQNGLLLSFKNPDVDLPVTNSWACKPVFRTVVQK